VLEITAHIEKLLLVHDCVIIPDFGGFVLQLHPSVYVGEEHLFCPPYKEIVFNPVLKHNDGLLSESYMQMYGMDFDEASKTLKKDVEKLKTTLSDNGKISLGAIGVLDKSMENTIVFHPDSSENRFNCEIYGLSMFNFSPISKPVPAKRNTTLTYTPAQVIYLPINKLLVYVAGMVAAIIFLFLLLTTPIKDVNSDIYTASFMPSEMVKQLAPVKTLEMTSLIVEKNDMKTINDTLSETEVEALTIDNKIIVEAPTYGMYYIIIGSFETERQARAFIDVINPLIYSNIGIVQKNNRIRVYVDKYENRDLAMNYIFRLREDKRFKDAWLFVDK
jgi:hypothetical protein